MRRVFSSRAGRALLTGAGAAGAAASVAALTALGGGQVGALSLSLLVLGGAVLARRPGIAGRRAS